MHEARGPSIWLVTKDAMPRRMRLNGRELRTVVSYDTMLVPMVETVSLDDIAAVEVVAPYTPPVSRIATLCTGLALGSAVASVLEMTTSIVIAIVFATFAAVASIIRGTGTIRYNLARLRGLPGGDRMISYQVEEEDRIITLFGADRWRNDNMENRNSPLLPEEQRQADALRIGLVLAASGVSLAILVSIFRIPSEHYAPILVPADIVQYSAISIVLFVAIKAWLQMLKNRSGR